jgi:hypothetical protein
MASRRATRAQGTVKLTPADAFDLIRWLARSQSDPRKAVAELVQNAIDAGARTIAIERRRRGRRAALIVRDDGEGIRPDDERDAALRYLATHIGRSHKRNLSPAERHAQVVAGKYGIGLLGFWSIGRRLDIRSRVAGSATWMLRLVEDEPHAEVVPAPPQIDAAATFTELVISEVHAAALRPLAIRRLAEYLGAELRGPLSSSGATVELREYDVRGQVVDRVAVTPRRFAGIRLAVPSPVAVSGYSPIGSSCTRWRAKRPAASSSRARAPSSRSASAISPRWDSMSRRGPSRSSPGPSSLPTSRFRRARGAA